MLKIVLLNQNKIELKHFFTKNLFNQTTCRLFVKNEGLPFEYRDQRSRSAQAHTIDYRFVELMESVQI